MRIRNMTLPKELRDLDEKLRKVRADKDRAIGEQQFERAAELRDEEEALKKEREEAEKQWEEDTSKTVQNVTVEDIADVVSMSTGVPVSNLTEAETEKLLRMEGVLHERIIGQDEAVTALSKAIRRSRSGLKDPKRPAGSFIFLGPSGVGKTELTKALAESLFDDERSMVRIDMSEYMEKFSVQRLIGAPPGYVGYEEGGQLTEAVRRHPYSVILLDEIEKAHPDVFNVLLQVLDDGRLTDGQGRVVSFKNSIIIMTSNLGSQFIQEFMETGDKDAMDNAIQAALRQSFRPEFLNRIDEIITFTSLDMEHLEKIVDLQLEKVRERLAERRIALELTPAVLERLSLDGFDPLFGARPLKRLIQHEIVDRVANEMVGGNLQEGDTITIDLDENGDYTVTVGE